MESKYKDELKPYLNKLKKILDGTSQSYPCGLTQIFDFLYLGGHSEATDLKAIKKNKITHVINCASSYVDTGEDFYGNAVKKYVGFDAEDESDYDMMQHFEAAFELIESARTSGEKALIHCIMGVNRSALLTVAYVMVHENIDPVSAAKKVIQARKHILSNDAFRWQLLEFAKERDMLEQGCSNSV